MYLQFYCNGLVLQKRKAGFYQGIEGDNWFLNSEDDIKKEIMEYYDEYIDLAWMSDDRVDVCNDVGYIKRCIDISKLRGIDYRNILCLTNKENPRMNQEDLNTIFLGYDFAYTGGSYYSAILNDIVSKRIKEFQSIRLNDKGLFDSIENLLLFINKRNMIKEKTEDYIIEDGDFVVYKLYEVVSL